MILPPAVAQPCNECPWRRNAWPGHLGPLSAGEWVAVAHSDAPVACHKTIVASGTWDGASQCRGIAIFRDNVNKVPRDPEVAVGPVDHVHVFSSSQEFIDHHN